MPTVVPSNIEATEIMNEVYDKHGGGRKFGKALKAHEEAYEKLKEYRL